MCAIKWNKPFNLAIYFSLWTGHLLVQWDYNVYIWQNHLWNIISLTLWWVCEREEIQISKSVEAGVRFLINWIESELRTPHNRESSLSHNIQPSVPLMQLAWRLVYGVKFHPWFTLPHLIVKAARIYNRDDEFITAFLTCKNHADCTELEQKYVPGKSGMWICAQRKTCFSRPFFVVRSLDTRGE